MKNLFKSVMVLSVVVFALMFTACDKDEDVNVIQGNNVETPILKIQYGYSFETTKLVLYESSATSEYGDKGNVYVSENNADDGLFEITAYAIQGHSLDHTYSSVTSYGVETVSCTGASSDCWVDSYKGIANCIFHKL